MINYISNFISGIIFSLIIPGIIFGILCIAVNWFIPTKFIQYKIPIELLGVILVIFFTFQEGRYTEYTKNQTQEAANKLLIADLKTKSEKINTEVLVQYVDRIKVVEKIKNVPVNVYVTKEADQKCIIDPTTSTNIRKLLNSAAEGRVPDTNPNSNGTTN